MTTSLESPPTPPPMTPLLHEQVDWLSPSAPVRHGTYYFDDGNVTFLIENVLFCIHKYFLVRDSEVFRTMFSLPLGNQKSVEGTSDDNPINLLGIRALDFERFLWVMYPPTFGEYNATLDEWCSILSLANQWEFDSVRDLAVSKLSKLSPPDISAVDRIVLAQKFQLTDWLLPPYVELSVRSQSLTIEEGRKLGIDTVILLARAREDVKQREGQNGQASEELYFTFGALPLDRRQSVWNTVAEIFGLPRVILGQGGKYPP